MDRPGKMNPNATPQKGGLRSLLDSLQSLYSGVVSLIVRDRINSYHVSGVATSDQDLATSLQSYIESRVTRQRSENPEKPNGSPTDIPGKDNSLSAESGHSGVSVKPNSDPSEPKPIPNPLSEYYDRKKSYSESKPHVCEKLISSAWEHTHATIRYTHRGEFDKAKLHAELADSALKQAAHYLSDEEYRAVKNDILDDLSAKG